MKNCKTSTLFNQMNSMGELAKKSPKPEKNTYKVEILHRVRGRCQETHIKNPHLQHLGITPY